MLLGLCEECRKFTAKTQLLVTSHSPEFVDGVRADELWVLYRDEKGYTKAQRASEMNGVPEFLDKGARLGDLWMEGYFSVGDPLVNGGASTTEFYHVPRLDTVTIGTVDDGTAL